MNEGDICPSAEAEWCQMQHLRAEIERLNHDIERHIKIATNEAAEVEQWQKAFQVLTQRATTEIDGLRHNVKACKAATERLADEKQELYSENERLRELIKEALNGPIEEPWREKARVVV